MCIEGLYNTNSTAYNWTFFNILEYCELYMTQFQCHRYPIHIYKGQYMSYWGEHTRRIYLWASLTKHHSMNEWMNEDLWETGTLAPPLLTLPEVRGVCTAMSMCHLMPREAFPSIYVTEDCVGSGRV